MPFTLAHPAAVWPLVGRRNLSGLALIVGAMAPDFEYFLRFELLSTISHTWPGLFVFDLPVTLAATVAILACRRALLRALPSPLAARLAPLLTLPAGPPWRALAILAVSALIGAATHLLWDGLTHGNGLFVAQAPALRETVALAHLGELPRYRALQHASTAFGLLALVVGVIRLPRASDPPASDRRAIVTFALLALAGALVIPRIAGAPHLGTWIVRTIDGGVVGALAALALIAAASAPRSDR